MQYLEAISKITEWSLFISKQTIQYHSIQVYASTHKAEEVEVERFYEDLQDLLELTPKKDALFIVKDWNAKVGSQETPGVTGKFGLGVQNEVGQRLTEFCQENELVLANTLFQLHRRSLYTWTSPDGQYWNHIGYILCSQRWRSSIQSAKTGLEADCGSDHELHHAKFRLKLKKVGETTRSFRYDLNQICYDYIVEVTKRFKGLDLIDRVPEDLWRFVTFYRRQGSRPSPRKRNAKKAKCLSEEVLQIAVNKREVKGKGEKEKYTYLNASFQRIAWRDKKAFPRNRCKDIEENLWLPRGKGYEEG